MSKINLTYQMIPLRILNVESQIPTYCLIIDEEHKLILPLHSVLDFRSLRDEVIRISKQYYCLTSIMTAMTFIANSNSSDVSKKLEDAWKELDRTIWNDPLYHITDKDYTAIDFTRNQNEKWSLNNTNLDDAIQYQHPAWDEFLNRVDSKMIPYFCAWIWSVYKADTDRSRLICWIQGKGNDGKSVIVKTLMNNLGPLATSVTNFDEKDKFLTSQLVGRNLIYLPDQDDDKLIENKLIKSITGQDMVKCEKKFGSPVSKTLRGKILITSNPMPKIKDSEASASRFMLIKVAPPTEELLKKSVLVWENELEQQIPSFLLTCKTHYTQLVGNKGVLKIDRAINEELIENSIGLDGQMVREFVDNMCVFGSNNKITIREFSDKCIQYCNDNSIKDESKFKNMVRTRIMDTGLVKQDRFRPVPGGQVVRGFIGVEFK